MVKKLLKTILINALILIFFPVYSQEQDSRPEDKEEILEVIQTGYATKVNPVLYSNLLFQKQNTNDNSIFSIQVQESSHNSLILYQTGNSNTIFSKQTGTNLKVQIEQNDSFNDVNTVLAGKNIHLNMSQQGKRNKINSEIYNDGMQTLSSRLIQKGNFNIIELALKGEYTITTSDQHIRIEQYGNNHQVEATFENLNAPVEIIQTPGAGGEGMQISISNSSFNFPIK